MRNIKFCCDNFTWLINESGRKGFSAIPTNFEEIYYFVLQTRNDDDKDKASVMQVSIHYCPWCGYKLSKTIDKNKDEIVKLAKENKYLLV